MSKTVELIEQLQIIFKTLTTNVYYEEAPDTSDYPYLVYEVSELVNNYGKTTLQLEVNLLDYGTLSLDIDILADTVQDTLHKYYFMNDEIQFTIYKVNRNTIKEEDKKIIRRRLTFEIQLHELKGE